MKRHSLFINTLAIALLSVMFALAHAQEKKLKEIPSALKAPDLVVTTIKCGPGNKLFFSIKNIGAASLPAGWKAVADVSFDGRKMGHIDLARPTSGDITPAGGTADYLAAFDIIRPVTVQIVADATNSIRESNERNNAKTQKVEPCERVTALPDLYVPSWKYEEVEVNFFNFPPDRPRRVAQGESKRVEVSIGNWGAADAVGDFSVGIYLSTVSGGGCRPTSIRLWGTTVTGGLRTVDVRSFSATITIPPTLAPGNYWMYPMVDDTNRIAERNEDANCSTSVPLTVVAR